MNQADLTKYGFLTILGLLLWLSFLTVKPYLTYLLFSVILVIIFYPVYKWLAKQVKKPKLASIGLVLVIIALLVVPSVFLGAKVIQEAPSAYEDIITNLDVAGLEGLAERLNLEVNLEQALNESVRTFRNYIFDNLTGVLTGTINVLLGLFMMFFVMYYLFTEGPRIIKRLKQVVPIDAKQQQELYDDIYDAVHGIINGMLIIGVIQGIVGGIIYFALGVPNAIFWALATTAVSIIPVIGAFAVWIPMAGWLFAVGETAKAIILVILGAGVISQIDNVIRPYIVSKTTSIHPALVIIGVLGGLAAFGVVGFVIGPLILALLVTVLSFYKNVSIEETD